MIKYRPNRNTIDEAMCNSKEFANLNDMYDYIVSKQNNNSDMNLFNKDDLSISEDFGTDERIGWKETRYVCTKRMGNQIFEHPQCIGMCSIES